MDAAEIARLTGLPENVVRDLMDGQAKRLYTEAEEARQIAAAADWLRKQSWHGQSTLANQEAQARLDLKPDWYLSQLGDA